MGGYDLLAPGDTVTASYLNEKLMAQTIARVASDARPTDPESGQFIWETDTGRLKAFDVGIDDWVDWQWISGGLPYTADAIIGTAPTPILTVPPVIYRHSIIATVSNTSGGFNVLYSGKSVTFPNCILWMSAVVGDTASLAATLVPYLDNCDLTQFNGIAYKPDGSVVGNGDTFRLNLEVIGC